MFMNDRPRIDEAFRNVSLTSVSGWPGSLSTKRFPVLRRKNGSPPIPSALSSQLSFVDCRINRWRNEVFQTSRVPGEFPPCNQFGVGERKRALPKQHTARYVEQERNYYRRVTYSDVLPLVESSHILHHAHRRARNNGSASGAIPILCKCQRSPCSVGRHLVPPSPPPLVLLNRRIG